MKLRTWIKNLTQSPVFRRSQSKFATIYCGQSVADTLVSCEPYMPLLSARCAVVCVSLGFFLAGFATSQAQTNYYSAYGTEYSIVGSLPGDQMYPDLALNKNGGYIVWQDNITDPVGLGISAMQINSTLSGSGAIFAVNTPTTNDQQNARVALLNNGGAGFVWQGGPDNIQHIYARFLNASNLWVTTTNVAVSASTNTFQSSPAIATLANGNVIAVWVSFDQAGSNSYDDVYGQLFSTNGTRIGTNFLINVFTDYNQKAPAVAALTSGKFVVAWASEQERAIGVTNSGTNSIEQLTALAPSVDIYERLFTNSGTAVNPLTGEVLVDQDNNPCAAPGVAAASDGSYMVTWCANAGMDAPTNGWDIFARSFTNSTGGPAIAVNSYTYGDQYNPQISAVGGDYLIVWTSLGEDGSREGVYGQFVHENGALTGNQFRVNTTTVGSQMQPAVASDGNSQFLAVWTSFTFGPNSDDLYAQRYENVGAVLAPMAAPFVWSPFVISNVDGTATYEPQLVVTWPAVQGLAVSNYEVFVNGSSSPMGIVTGDCWTMTAADGLGYQDTNSFQVAYTTSSGFLSPLSPATVGGTWQDCDWYGIPCQWMTEYYGSPMYWPSATTSPVVPGGPSLLQIFMTGGNPTNSATWLRTALTRSSQGLYLNWNTQPGMTYQVQITSDFRTWNNFGAPRFEAGTNDSVYVGNGGGGYYRVQLLQP